MKISIDLRIACAISCVLLPNGIFLLHTAERMQDNADFFAQCSLPDGSCSNSTLFHEAIQSNHANQSRFAISCIVQFALNFYVMFYFLVGKYANYESKQRTACSNLAVWIIEGGLFWVYSLALVIGNAFLLINLNKSLAMLDKSASITFPVINSDLTEQVSQDTSSIAFANLTFAAFNLIYSMYLPTKQIVIDRVPLSRVTPAWQKAPYQYGAITSNPPSALPLAKDDDTLSVITTGSGYSKHGLDIM